MRRRTARGFRQCLRGVVSERAGSTRAVRGFGPGCEFFLSCSFGQGTSTCSTMSPAAAARDSAPLRQPHRGGGAQRVSDARTAAGRGFKNRGGSRTLNGACAAVHSRPRRHPLSNKNRRLPIQHFVQLSRPRSQVEQLPSNRRVQQQILTKHSAELIEQLFIRAGLTRG